MIKVSISLYCLEVHGSEHMKHYYSKNLNTHPPSYSIFAVTISVTINVTLLTICRTASPLMDFPFWPLIALNTNDHLNSFHFSYFTHTEFAVSISHCLGHRPVSCFILCEDRYLTEFQYHLDVDSIFYFQCLDVLMAYCIRTRCW